MFGMNSTLLSVVLGAAVAGLLTLALFYPRQTYHWFQRKRYQYDVTLALYMLTPKEKFVFNSILFLSLTLLGIAAILYLPEHLSQILSRVWYYLLGDHDLSSLSSTLLGREARANASQAAREMGRRIAEGVKSAGAGVGVGVGTAAGAAEKSGVAGVVSAVRKSSGEVAREMLGI